MNELKGEASHNTSGPTYRIGPGDALHVFVWGNKELSMDVTVRPDGFLTTPLIEDVRASGKTPTELAREMESKLTRYIKNPKITVTVTRFLGRYAEQVRVLGEAVKPQALPYKESMSLLDVIIAVGGLSEIASGNNAKLIRTINGKKTEYQLRLGDLYEDGDMTANAKVLPGDIIVIPESWF
ncbi:MAG: polysaccharide export protein [Gammaproteobacteria bacterium]|nr:polysaccharide export protein [Gammaproteobacteria bacterium]MDH5652386.1 polysaccharide export protein [Gammaproteobacteria bacterium]